MKCVVLLKMPFVQRIVEPKYLSRTSLHNENGEPIISDYELEAVTNNTLSNALRQLASLVLVANDIFTELTKELQNVSTRSSALKVKIGDVEKKVEEYDPKLVAVRKYFLLFFINLENLFIFTIELFKYYRHYQTALCNNKNLSRIQQLGKKVRLK